ncbi:hypothetical protein NPIL_656191 [Nephila pilipes]|uniref:Uncharacterized protein n=1 Tax=Nephila pilipes TaxID=299642 RepID=A0A8X6PTF7_NEPPI|nr:hypothetical protein NPIL_656191 [Nephila pilipes]
MTPWKSWQTCCRIRGPWRTVTELASVQRSSAADWFPNKFNMCFILLDESTPALAGYALHTWRRQVTSGRFMSPHILADATMVSLENRNLEWEN